MQQLSRRIAFTILRWYSTLWMRCKAKVIVEGQENLPPDRADKHRVYIVINHSTTYDLVALMHISKKPFSVLVDRGAFAFPIVGKLLSAAGFIPLDKESSSHALRRCHEEANKGTPIVVSLHDGDSTIGVWGKPRTGGIRIAHSTGAMLVPVFLYLEPEKIRRLSFKGTNKTVYPYTTFRNTRYWIRILPQEPIDQLHESAGYEDFTKLAEKLDALRFENQKPIDAKLQAEKDSKAKTRRFRGGTKQRIEW